MHLRSRIRMAAVVTASALAAACSADRAVSSGLPAHSAEARPASDSATTVGEVQLHVERSSGYLLSTGRQ